MIERLFHYYRKGSRPFQSLSLLPESQAISIMEALCVPDSVLWRRFGDPRHYMDCRRTVEAELHRQFLEKGGRAKLRAPIYFVVGRPRWTVATVDAVTMETTEEIMVLLSAFDPQAVSFTYPDSMMISYTAGSGGSEKRWPEWFGRVQTLSEMEMLIAQEGLSVERWLPDRPLLLSFYIEAQVWDDRGLGEYIRDGGGCPGSLA